MKVKDRQGNLQEFDINRIKNALSRAFKECHYDTLDPSIISEIANKVYIWDGMSIEEIQDQVEELLMDYEYSDVAKEYILYRYKHKLSRQLADTNKFNTTITEIATGKKNEITNENGNKDARRFNVMRDLIAGESCKKLYKEFEADKELLALHEKGAIHIHDTDYRFMRGITNCSLISLYDMLWNGTVVNGKLIERPHSLRTATTIATQIMTAVSSAQFGGISITMTHLAPFVRVSKEYYEKQYNKYGISPEVKKELVEDSLKKEIRDSVQTLLYQLNSMTSTNGQFGRLN